MINEAPGTVHLLATGFYDAGFGRFLTTPAAAGAAAGVVGVLAYIATTRKTAAEREAARKNLTYAERRDVYRAFDDPATKALDGMYAWAWSELGARHPFFSRRLVLLAASVPQYDAAAAASAREAADRRLSAALHDVSRVAPQKVTDCANDIIEHLSAFPPAVRETLERDRGLIRLVVLLLLLKMHMSRKRRYDRAWHSDLGLEREGPVAYRMLLTRPLRLGWNALLIVLVLVLVLGSTGAVQALSPVRDAAVVVGSGVAGFAEDVQNAITRLARGDVASATATTGIENSD